MSVRWAKDAGRAVMTAMVLLGAAGRSGALPAADEPGRRPAANVPIKAEPFALKDVRLLDGPFRDAMNLNAAYLRSLDNDRLLHVFRVNAGLPSSAQPYGGWESPGCELRGHSVGHVLSALALSYAATGEADLKAKAEALTAELAKCQDALAAKASAPGYLSAFPESFMNRVEKRERVWAPWYTLHKLYAGFIDVHEHCGNAQALAVVTKMAGWAKARLDRLTPEQTQKMLGEEFGGMNEALANLYAVTGDPAHLATARRFDHAFVFDPLAAGQDKLTGLHANTQVPKAIGAAREYELTGDTRYRDIASFFWKRVALVRSYVIGGHSDHEYFFPVEEFSKHLSPATTETCNTYNMLKLSRHLFAWEPSAEVMDFYERGLYNHILASQDPAKGMFVYLMPLKPGHFKTYSTPFDSFWCCVGTGMENHAKYADTIYFHGADALFVNLFIASELNWKERGLTVRQETSFPESDSTRLTFTCTQPVKLTVQVRRPAWATAGFEMSVNGAKIATDAKPGSYAAIEREWKSGDRLDVRLPMTLRTEAMPDNPNVLAVLYGPIVLAAELGRAGIENTEPYVRGQSDLLNVPTPPVPQMVGAPAEVVGKIEPVAGKPLTFRTKGLVKPDDVTLIPLHRLNRQRYTVYWTVRSAADWARLAAEAAAAEAKRRAEEARTIDRVRIGEQQPETDHAFRAEQSESGEHAGRNWRHAKDGGWFSYDVKVEAGKPANLVCTYWGGDAHRSFDVLIDGTKVVTQKLTGSKPNEFIEVVLPLTAAMTAGKDKITVRFQAPPDGFAGGLFGLATLRPE